MGQVLKRIGRFADAEALIKRSWTLSQAAHAAIRNLSSNYLDWTGDVRGALEILESVPERLRDSPLFFSTRAPLHVMRGDWAAAVADYEQVREYVRSGRMTTSGPRSGSVSATYQIAWIAARQGNAARAAELYTDALAAAQPPST